MNNILVIGIAGGSGSGKTTLMKNLVEKFSDNVTVLSHDNYYKRHDELSYEERCLLNYDEPSIFDHDLLLEDVRALLSGKRVLKKEYDYALHRRAPQKQEYLEPHEVIIVEAAMRISSLMLAKRQMLLYSRIQMKTTMQITE